MMVEALVEHDYVAKEPNELTITKGDIVKDVIKKQGGWLEGTLKDKKGLFPDNFVRVMDKETVVLRNRKDATRIRQCRVVYSYKQDHEDELNLNVGDIIDILGEEEEGWWRGVLNGKQGVFPSNFVEEIVSHKTKISSRENLTDLPDATPFVNSKPTKILCEVKFAYKAQNEDELTLKEGDIVTVLSKDGQDPGWWKGELSGVSGVFPDNFVTLLAADDKSTKDDSIRKAKSCADPVGGIKPGQVTSQRRSLEVAQDRESDSKTTPPVPGKKPVIPIKKSPSGSGTSLFYGLKKKIVDAVDGATGSKQSAVVKTEMSSNENLTSENAFDDVVRRPLLSDIRASRPKAPGRRLPSVIFKDMEPGVPNGNSEYVPETASSSSPEIDATDSKPKLREWEKHKAPWLAEMKLNQAKRTSTSPGPPEHKLKLPTPTDKATTEPQPAAPAEETTPKKPVAAVQNHETETPEIQSRPLSALAGRLKTPPNELEKTPMLRNKSNVPTPTRPQTIHNVNTSSLNEVAPHNLPKPSPPFHPKVSPITTTSITNRTPSPLQKAHTVDKSNERTISADFGDGGNNKQNYADMLERIAKLEELVEKQNRIHAAALDDLRNKLQLETEMRMKLQAEVEELVKDNGAIQQL